MTQNKRCTRLSVHRPHDYMQNGRAYHCTGVAEDAQDSNYMTNPYYSAPVTPYYTDTPSYSSSSSDCSSSSSSDSYSSSSDSGSSSSSCE